METVRLSNNIARVVIHTRTHITTCIQHRDGTTKTVISVGGTVTERVDTRRQLVRGVVNIRAYLTEWLLCADLVVVAIISVCSRPPA